MIENICHFIPYHKDYHSIHTINFVFETQPQPYSALKSDSLYKIYFVCSGKGKLHIAGRVIPLSEGDVFFTFPAMPHCIESGKDFTFMYISFLGSRANMIMDKLKITTHNFHFKNCNEIFDFWKKGLDSNPEITDLMSESILLYSFSYLGNSIIPAVDKKASKSPPALIIKKYIDDNFSTSGLSLELLSKELSYSPKYISSVFKKAFNVGITEYLNTIRIQNACTLIRQGFTSICDVASMCGYTDPQYFSKLFKQKTGISPKEYGKSDK